MQNYYRKIKRRTRGRIEVTMSHIAEAVRPKFETLSADLKSIILEKNVNINNLQDLIHVLEEIVAEGEQ